jgi:hypothetical protein
MNEDEYMVDEKNDKKKPRKIYGLNHNKDVDVRSLDLKNKWISSNYVFNFYYNKLKTIFNL